VTSKAAVRGIKARIRRLNRRLSRTDVNPSNADRALWGALAIAQLVTVDSAGAELALSDLLADLMHWCDLQASGPRPRESVAFNLALDRARTYYEEERRAELRPTNTTVRRGDHRV